LGAYIPAKYAVQGMLVMLREELSPQGVRVYSVAPGFMHGGMNSDVPMAFAEMIREKSDTKKLTTAVDVAERVAYLCNDKSREEKSLTFVVSEE
jgi:NAD(P)-dependent dehydrogenase (short-subunit alcohol dehydrogenase family)